MFGKIENSHGEQIDYSFHEADGQNLAIIGHGVTGNKDRPFVVALAEGLAAVDVPTLRISFSGNGDSGGRFQNCTISKEVGDLGAVLDAIGKRPVGYIGHSMGGAVGVIRASEDERLQWLVSLAGMVHTSEFAQREFGDEQPDAGFMWEDEDCPLSKEFMDDMTAISTVAVRGSAIQVPWLLVHGSEDDVVPLQDSHDILVEAVEPKPKLVEIDGGDHVFNDAAKLIMVETVAEWIKKIDI